MAQIISGSVASVFQRSSYNWDELLDGQTRIVSQGEDFQTSIQNFRNYAYNVARQRGIKLATRITTNDVGQPALMIQALNV